MIAKRWCVFAHFLYCSTRSASNRKPKRPAATQRPRSVVELETVPVDPCLGTGELVSPHHPDPPSALASRVQRASLCCRLRWSHCQRATASGTLKVQILLFALILCSHSPGPGRLYCFPCAGSGAELFRDFQAPIRASLRARRLRWCLGTSTVGTPVHACVMKTIEGGMGVSVG